VDDLNTVREIEEGRERGDIQEGESEWAVEEKYREEIRRREREVLSVSV